MKDVGVRVPLPALEVHMSVGLGLARREGEGYRDVIVRLVKENGPVEECLEEFDRLLGNGVAEDEAAWAALYEWDCLPIVEV